MKKAFKITVFILLIAFSFSFAGCFYDMDDYSGYDYYDTGDDYATYSSLYDFKADTEYVSEYSFSNVVFSVYLDGYADSVELMTDTGTMAYMYDDGMNLDEAAGDGIYTAYIALEATDPKTVTFWAQAGGAVSNTFDLSILALPDSNAAASIGFVIRDMEEISNINESPEVQISNAQAYVEELYNSGEVISYISDGESVEFVHYSGVKFCFMPEIEDVLQMGDGTSATIVTMEPFDSEFSDVEFSTGQEFLSASGYADTVAANISQTFPNFYFSSALDYDETEVTPALFENLSPNTLLIWFGHGGYSKSEGSFLVTREKYNEQRISVDTEYYNKFLSGEYITTGNGEIGITAKFVNKNVPDISGSFIFLNACQSAKTTKLVNSFIAKGADCVAAYTASVYVFYAAEMQYTILSLMHTVNPATGDYYTLKEAYTEAVRLYGESDNLGPHITSTKEDAYLVYYGMNADNLRFGTTGSSAPVPSVPEENANAEANEIAHSAYKDLLERNAWIPFCPSDLSEIPEDQYDEYWLGTYYCCDINKDGIDELIIKAGQSIADMSMTFFTWTDDGVMHLGSLQTGDAFFYNLTSESGCIITEHHGGMGVDTYVDLINNELSIYDQVQYNYEQADYYDEKPYYSYAVNGYNVHDTSGL